MTSRPTLTTPPTRTSTRTSTRMSAKPAKTSAPLGRIAVAALLAAGLSGCAVVAVADATVTVAATAVGAAASVAGLAVDATVGTARLAGRTVAAVVPGGPD